MTVKLAEVYRNGTVESIHRGDIAVVDCHGGILYKLGDPEKKTFMRSASKPIYSIAMLESGVAEQYGLDLKEIALITSSHSGEKEHVDVLKGIMEKAGIEEKLLKCGAHPPLNKDAAKELASTGQPFTRLHCNCSGKHTGMIATAKMKELTLENYYEPEHQVQVSIRKVLSEFCGLTPDALIRGMDGCGVPVYAMPLRNMAYSYANLCNPDFAGGKYVKSQNYILSSMTMFPEMIGGSGRFDTRLMKHYGDRLIGKFGEEGVYCIGLLKDKIGIAVKIEDGNSRAVGPVVIELLKQMNVLCKEEAEVLKEYSNPEIRNHSKEKVGEIKAVFKMDAVRNIAS